MERGLTTKEENLYDQLISMINVALIDYPKTRDKIIQAVDDLIDELLDTNEEGLW